MLPDSDSLAIFIIRSRIEKFLPLSVRYSTPFKVADMTLINETIAFNKNNKIIIIIKLHVLMNYF